ncbi:nucleoside recognition domain-containing protein [Sedimentibacter sp.]|uniref:nucleoside recognition domain-containing protein n=1 Tax=Sedimentibacter sp. TaxID=1960295 RepID=UPI000EC66291|nr:nucleoside recognition domain-containing protein [Sedimentibacter sp.]HCX61557.1 nucleoside recognition protein [Clostridiales bacterium]
MNAIIGILINLISFIWSITKVLIPIMIIIEIFKDTQLIDRLSKAIKPISNFFTISEKSGVSLLFGMTFGLTIGAGAIIQSVKDYDVDKRSIFLITMFLSVCHALIEDSMIFAGVGANIAALLGARFISAILITFILSKFIKKDAFEIEK